MFVEPAYLFRSSPGLSGYLFHQQLFELFFRYLVAFDGIYSSWCLDVLTGKLSKCSQIGVVVLVCLTLQAGGPLERQLTKIVLPGFL